ncbi:methionine-R-sulfoxide reductase B2, mitochondrial-like [Anneissia japonica]|uniref:methionine-R-sulfoxide reductase B2, mitochondrial-like n=1 Tax=Anneissia japonica TaxID=1529436 RepID=UPI00142561FD|nr:methionine-R-sulfoxide reductase B2, mitochondrial-like [Anneissia japonica]
MFSVVRYNANRVFRMLLLKRMQPGLNRCKSTIVADARQSLASRSLNSTGEKDWAARATNTDWEKILTPEQYFVCREGGTEEPFTGINFSNFEEGLYKCVCCSAVLFSSEAKYDSGYGWPSFHCAEEEGSSVNVVKVPDDSSGVAVTQVVCRHCESQLGHVLQDPNNSSKECYCVNSTALHFEAK